MKAILPVAGYATRLFPLTENLPKTLLKVGDKTLLDHTIEKIEELGIKDIYITTNAKFYEHFVQWQKSYTGPSKITIINDNTTSNEDRLGAIGDIWYTIQQANIKDEDILVIGGDNLYRFSLQNTYKLYLKNNQPTIICYDLQDYEAAKKYGIAEVDKNQKVIAFQEKPVEPKSTLVATCTYFYPKHVIPIIGEYLGEGNNPDSPGNFPAWLVENGYDVYAQSHTDKRYDIGSFESLKEAKEDYGEGEIDIENLKKGII